MKSAYKLLLLFILCSCSMSVMAQERLDRVISNLEKKDKVQTTYTEHRTQTRHKLYRTSLILTFTDQQYYKMLEQAFEAERRNSIRAVKNNNTYHYRFRDRNGESTYILSKADGSYTLVKSWNSANDKDDNEEACNSVLVSGNKVYYSYSLSSAAYEDDIERRIAEIERKVENESKALRDYGKRIANSCNSGSLAVKL